MNMRYAEITRTEQAVDIASKKLSLADASMSEWESPIPLLLDSRTLFPIECLPPWLSDWVKGVSRMLQVPNDGVAMLGIGAIATGIMRKVNINPMPGMIEPTCAYIEIVAEIGERKSPMFKAAVKPIEEYESDKRSELAPIAEADEAKLGALLARLKQAQQRYGKAKKNEMHDCEVALRLASEELSEFKANMTRLPKLITDNTTTEKLGLNLFNNDERLAVMSADTDLLSIMAGKYTGVVDYGIYLNAHPGDRVVVDRMTRELVLEAPQLTCAFTVQPSVLRDMQELKGAEARGLIARFWYVVPAKNSGSRIKEPLGLPETARIAYFQKIKNLLDLPVPKEDNTITPYLLTLTQEASDKFWQYYLAIEQNRTEYGELSDLPKGWASKLEGTLARLTAILHMGDYASSFNWQRPVEMEIVDRAYKIAMYLVDHARAAAEIMHQSPNVNNATILLDWIVAHGHKEFSKRNAYRSLHRKFKEDITAMDKPLQILEENKYIQNIKTKTKEQQYRVNPKVLASGNQRQWRQSGLEGTPLAPLTPLSPKPTSDNGFIPKQIKL